jgi:spermidine synthase
VNVDNHVNVRSSLGHTFEYLIHNAAQYGKEVRRIVIIGGGNSMLLHEALKYSCLELVVILELDQDIARRSSMYVGTYPHFDNQLLSGGLVVQEAASCCY